MSQLLTIPGITFLGVACLAAGAVVLYLTSGRAPEHRTTLGEVLSAKRRLDRFDRPLLRSIVLWSVFNPVSCYDYGARHYLEGALVTLGGFIAGSIVLVRGLLIDARRARRG